MKKKYIQSIFQELYSHLRTLSRLYRFVFARLGVLFDNPIKNNNLYKSTCYNFPYESVDFLTHIIVIRKDEGEENSSGKIRI